MGKAMRERLTFACEGAQCAASFDRGGRTDVGLLIVSGGNEILAGAHRGMALLAAEIAGTGVPVFRYDRRGIGDSDGDNGGFRASGPDMAAAVAAFRQASGVHKVTAFGNCDAATALALFGEAAGIDKLILANPWTYDDVYGATGAGDADSAPAHAFPPAAAIRARYWARLKDPRQLWRLVSGGVDLRKLVSGLRAARRGANSVGGLADELIAALSALQIPATILLAEHDRTAMAFAEAWKHAPLATKQRTKVARCATASHSFADDVARAWLKDQIRSQL